MCRTRRPGGGGDVLRAVGDANSRPQVSSRIRPSVEMVTTYQGMNLPLSWRAFFTASSMPPQQGTSMRTTVTL